MREKETIADCRRLVVQIHPTKNTHSEPESLGIGSELPIIWKCTKSPDHVWRAVCRSRTKLNSGCSMCSKKHVSILNSFSMSGLPFVKEWHPILNTNLKPHTTVAGSGKYIWWKCTKAPDHVWSANLDNRSDKNSCCPFCRGGSGKTSIDSSFFFRTPQQTKEWHPILNKSLPHKVKQSSNQAVWWKCKQNPDHVWKTTPSKRSMGSKCPYCSGQKITSENSLWGRFPRLALEYHPDNKTPPYKLSPGTHKKVKWKCKQNQIHIWSASVKSRAYSGTGCPHCRLQHRSIQEIRLAFELSYHLDIDHDFSKIHSNGKIYDVDICSPKENLIIEFDGYYFHRNNQKKDSAARDREKSMELVELGWRVIRVRERPLQKLSEHDVVVDSGLPADVCALEVLQHLQRTFSMNIPNIEDRLVQNRLFKSKEADAYIAKLQRQQSQTKK